MRVSFDIAIERSALLAATVMQQDARRLGPSVTVMSEVEGSFRGSDRPGSTCWVVGMVKWFAYAAGTPEQTHSLAAWRRAPAARIPSPRSDEQDKHHARGMTCRPLTVSCIRNANNPLVCRP